MTGCTEPKLIQEGSLIAYLEDDVDERVSEHIARCPACADKVARICQTNQALLALSYRISCPPPQVLAQYQLNLLPSGEQLKVAAHARACLHCTRELVELGQKEDSLSRTVLQVIKDAFRVVDGILSPSPRLHPAGVRGPGAGQHVFHGAGLDVLVGFQPTASGKGDSTLVGAVLQAETVADNQVWLFREGEKPRSSTVDGLGTFVFESVAPGEYDLALAVRDEALLMRGVVLDEA